MQSEHIKLPFTFGFQRNKYDNAPVPCSASTWGDFVAVFDETRDVEKGGYNIVAQMSGDDVVDVGSKAVARRCKGNVQPRRWIAFDLDGATRINDQKVPLSDEAFADIVMFASCIGQGLYYETSSSRVDDRHARFVFALDAALPRESIIALCKYIESLMPRADWDGSVYKGEQPLYLPLEQSKVICFEGEPIDVASIAPNVVAHAPKPKVFAPRIATPVQIQRGGLMLGCLQEMGLYVAPEGNGKHTIICPWGDLHSDGRLEAAYYEPSGSNGDIGGFRCLHAHCEHRNIGSLMSFVEGYAAEEVRHAA